MTLKFFGILPTPLLVAAFDAKWRSARLKTVLDWLSRALRNRDGVIQRGAGRGLRFNPGPSHASYLLGLNEPDVQTAMSEVLAPGMIVFDIGANVGFHSVIAAKLVGPSGAVVSFEPVRANAERLRYNASLNGFSHLTVREEAIGARDVDAEPFVLASTSTAGRLATVTRKPDHPIGIMSVRLRRLDTMMTEAHLPIPDLIKIDVEGAEADVLSGALDTIHRYRPTIMIELHSTNTVVCEALRQLHNYFSVALEGCCHILDAHWNAYIIAVPNEDRTLCATVESLSRRTSLSPRRV
jgi:FkbM family methyltransferase